MAWIVRGIYMRRSELKLKMAVIMLLAMVFAMCGCRHDHNGGGGLLTGKKDLTDKYKSAAEYCKYWYGAQCYEIDSFRTDSSDSTVHKIRDDEFGFEYYVFEADGYYFSSDFEYYYIEEFLKRTDFYYLIGKYDLKIMQKSEDKTLSSRTIIIENDRELTDEESGQILSDVKEKLAQFDSKRNVFGKTADKKVVELYVWSAPWEKDKAEGHRTHVVKTVFGDN